VVQALLARKEIVRFAQSASSSQLPAMGPAATAMDALLPLTASWLKITRVDAEIAAWEIVQLARRANTKMTQDPRLAILVLSTNIKIPSVKQSASPVLPTAPR
jgi:hypothetical protein